MAERNSNGHLRAWERAWLAVFGLFVATSDPDPAWLGVALTVVGVAIVLAAVGVVEVAMALYYRAQRRRRLGRQQRTADRTDTPTEPAELP